MDQNIYLFLVDDVWEQIKNKKPTTRDDVWKIVEEIRSKFIDEVEEAFDEIYYDYCEDEQIYDEE